jgi:hypothetical protein
MRGLPRPGMGNRRPIRRTTPASSPFPAAGNSKRRPPQGVVISHRDKARTVTLFEHGLFGFQRVEQIGPGFPSLSKERRAPIRVLRTVTHVSESFSILEALSPRGGLILSWRGEERKACLGARFCLDAGREPLSWRASPGFLSEFEAKNVSLGIVRPVQVCSHPESSRFQDDARLVGS